MSDLPSVGPTKWSENDKDQTEYSYKPRHRRDDEASTTLPDKPGLPRRAKDQLRNLALTGRADGRAPVSDRVRLGEDPSLPRPVDNRRR